MNWIQPTGADSRIMDPADLTAAFKEHFGAVVAVTRDGGKSWNRVSFPKPARVPGGMHGDAFMAIGQIQCPQANTCVALGVSDQGSKSTPVYTSNP